MKVVSEKALLKKWEKLIEHKNAPAISSQRDAVIMAKILEAQEGFEKRNASKLFESTTSSAGLTSYKPILVPMMRRITPQLISMKVFGVQPMNGPTGIVFAIRPGLQGSSETSGGTTRKSSNIVVLADASGFEVGDSISGETSGATGTVIHIENNSLLVNLDDSDVEFVVGESVDDAAVFVSAESTVSSRYIIDYSSSDETNEALFNFVFTNYSFIDSLATAEAASTDIKEVGFDITSTSVEAKTYKLKAKYSLELAEDYNAIHGESAESELMKYTADAITLEQNQIFINQLYTTAELNAIENFDYVEADGRWQAEKAQNAVSKINAVAMDISESSRRGEANFMVATKGVINLLKDSGRFDKTDDVVNMNGSYVGKLDGTIDVYNNVYRNSTTEETAVLGYVGGDKDAGIYYCPYVGLTPIKTVDPESGNPILLMRTRAGLLENPFGARAYYRSIRFSRLYSKV